MHDALLVGVAERVGDLVGDVDDVGHRQRMLLVVLQELAEVAAFEELHDEVEDAVVLAEVVDDGDSAVLECRGDPGLAAEALAQHPGERLVVLRPHRLEALDGDLPAQRFVARAPHLAHAAAPDQIEQPVPALDQPGVRHRLLSPPSLVAARPPRPVQYGSPVCGVCTGPGGSRGRVGHRLQDVAGRQLPAQAGGDRAQGGARGAQAAVDGARGRCGPAVQLVGERGQGVVGEARPRAATAGRAPGPAGRVPAGRAGSRRRRAPRRPAASSGRTSVEVGGQGGGRRRARRRGRGRRGGRCRGARRRSGRPGRR